MAQEVMVVSSIIFLAFFGMPKSAHCCLHCDKDFTNKFNYYRKHLWWRSSWAGDLVYGQKFINSWMKEMKESKISMPKEDLKTIAHEVYSMMDEQYKLSHTGIAVQVCSEHCGIYRVDYIDCTNCVTKPVECGHKCPENNMRGMSLAEVNVTGMEESHTSIEKTPLIILPILAATALFLGFLVGLYYCAKSRKKKHPKGQAESSNLEKRNSVQKKSSKRKRLKKWKKQKQRKKQEIDYSTE
ncbi:izumo sperm-egg fusion protein 4-like isoform X2 [Narcine bancroftii]|uniref:izumo sperm-egg fusion protein 4-like isoform X2 n=1 Tax=Narcine bancroftii TaxID=1343680 RepID=UPI003831BC24